MATPLANGYNFIGSSFSLYFSKLNPNGSNFYILLGSMTLMKKIELQNLFLCIAIGWKKFFNKNIYLELELGPGAFIGSDYVMGSLHPGVSLGYKF